MGARASRVEGAGRLPGLCPHWPAQALTHTYSPRLPGPSVDLWPPVSWSQSSFRWPLRRPDLASPGESAWAPSPQDGQPAAFSSGPAHWTPGPCPRCPLGSELQAGLWPTFLGPRHRRPPCCQARKPTSVPAPRRGQEGEAARLGSLPVPQGQRLGASCTCSPRPASTTSPCPSGSSPLGPPVHIFPILLARVPVLP